MTFSLSAAYIQPGDVVTMAAPYDRTAGQGAMIGSIFGVATATVLSGVDCPFALEGVFSLTKTDSQAWVLGDKIYWNASTKCVSNVSADGPMVGVCVEAVAVTTGLVLGKVLLLGSGAASPLLEGAQAAIASLTGAGSGTANGSLVAEGTLSTAGGNTYTDAAVNTILAKLEDNIAEIAAKQEAMLVAMRTTGIIAP